MPNQHKHSNKPKKWHKPYIGKKIKIPGSIFNVDIPGYFYEAVIKKPDNKTRFLVVKFLDDNSLYRFNVQDIDIWIQKEQNKNLKLNKQIYTPETDTQSEEEIVNYAAEALISLRSGVEFKDDEKRKMEEEEVQGKFRELVKNYPGIFDGIEGMEFENFDHFKSENQLQLNTKQKSRKNRNRFKFNCNKININSKYFFRSRNNNKRCRQNYCTVEIDDTNCSTPSYAKRNKTKVYQENKVDVTDCMEDDVTSSKVMENQSENGTNYGTQNKYGNYKYKNGNTQLRRGYIKKGGDVSCCSSQSTSSIHNKQQQNHNNSLIYGKKQVIRKSKRRAAVLHTMVNNNSNL